MSPSDLIRQAIQQLLDAAGDGWVVDQFVLSLGLQRMNSSGEIESSAWVWAPSEQPDWQTDGLLQASLDMRDEADVDTD